MASQVEHIRHWRVIEDDYRTAPDIEATWFVDPPYQDGGEHYPCGSDDIDYAELGQWCQSRKGQRIVCERAGASWLPFRDIGTVKSGPRTRTTEEAVWP